MAKKKKKRVKHVKEPGLQLETKKDYYCKGIPKEIFKKIPEELKKFKEGSLVHVADRDKHRCVGIVKKVTAKFVTILQFNNDNRTGDYEFDQIMLVPENSKTYIKYKEYIK